MVHVVNTDGKVAQVPHDLWVEKCRQRDAFELALREIVDAWKRATSRYGVPHAAESHVSQNYGASFAKHAELVLAKHQS